jgi:CRISPR system Cascade subunit CasD
VTTLVCRLAGPLQSWGENAQYTRRPSLPYPTYSGLLGLARAALGYDRDGNDSRTGQPVDDQWLRQLAMAIRIDQTGGALIDYHTINPPDFDAFHWLAPADRKRLAMIPMGSGKPWVIQGSQPTMITHRTYLTNAVFTWFVEGRSDDIIRLTTALTEPYWQLSLGRKACLPDQPLVLGTAELGIPECAALVPATGRAGRRTLHIIGGASDDGRPAGSRTITHADLPVGPHPQDGHTYLTRVVTHSTPPSLKRHDLLQWAKENLNQ